MAASEPLIELEVLSEEFVVTPALARLLVKLARRHLEWEARQANGSSQEEHVA